MTERPESHPVDPLAFEAAARARVAGLSPDVDLRAMSFVFDLLRVVNRLLHDFDAHVYRPRGLTWAGFRVLFSLWVEPESPPARLAVLSGVSRATISSVLKTLERNGLVRRSRESEDRRVVTVTITERGERLVREAFLAQHRRERAWVDDLDPDDVDRLVEVLRSLLVRPAPAE